MNAGMPAGSTQKASKLLGMRSLGVTSTTEVPRQLLRLSGAAGAEAGPEAPQRAQVVRVPEEVGAAAQGPVVGRDGGPGEVVLLLHEAADEKDAVDTAALAG
eukprot:CAMPEP_0179314622 /NCGR_PEP_ID=MMETSP0797-20121207/54583_1 /TAXON_ID=47934 /ORGANISM="Dinophysis acuminata, Strain DAEP01" /LENGTH=101 /DNA_ID=CAMNT_0021025005 /DNA_START=42 /DNA_END=344 /DNA_ORIENTATION=-